jgi:hypothetical protein
MKERFRRLLRCSVQPPLTPADEAEWRRLFSTSSPPSPYGEGGEEVRTVVEDEAGDERRLSGKGTLMG